MMGKMRVSESPFLLSLGWNLLLSYFSVFVLVWCLLDVTEQFCFLLLVSVGQIFGAGFQVFLGLLVIRLVMLIFCSLTSGAVASRLSTVLITLVWDHPTLSLSLLNRRCFGITDVRQTVLFWTKQTFSNSLMGSWGWCLLKGGCGLWHHRALPPDHVGSTDQVQSARWRVQATCCVGIGNVLFRKYGTLH